MYVNTLPSKIQTVREIVVQSVVITQFRETLQEY